MASGGWTICATAMPRRSTPSASASSKRWRVAHRRITAKRGVPAGSAQPAQSSLRHALRTGQPRTTVVKSTRGERPLADLLACLAQAMQPAEPADATTFLDTQHATGRAEITAPVPKRLVETRHRTATQRSLTQAPENAGPLNSHLLVRCALERMRGVSPDYLGRFVVCGMHCCGWSKWMPGKLGLAVRGGCVSARCCWIAVSWGSSLPLSGRVEHSYKRDRLLIQSNQQSCALRSMGQEATSYHSFQNHLVLRIARACP